MRLVMTVVAALLLLPAAQAMVTLDAPSTTEGALAADLAGTAVLVLADGTGDMTWPVGASWNYLEERRPTVPGLTPKQSPPVMEQRQGNVEVGSSTTVTTSGTTVIVIEGTFHLTGTGGAEIAAMPAGRCASDDSTGSWYGGHAGLDPCTTTAAVRLLLAPHDWHITFEATKLAWHGVHTTCTGCPPSGAEEDDKLFEVITATKQGVVTLAGPTTGNLGGHVLFASFTSQAADVLVDGRIRLPLADLDFNGCVPVDGQTIEAWGPALRLDQVTALDDRRYSFQLSGTAGGAQIDGSTIAPEAIGLTVAIVAGALLLLPLVAMLFGFLSTRVAKEEVLDNENRKGIYDYILAHPGPTMREIQRRNEVGVATARHHLRILKHHGFISEVPRGRTLRYFENHGRFDGVEKEAVALRNPCLAKLHRWLDDHPASRQLDAINAMEAAGWSRSVTQKRLGVLLKAGLATKSEGNAALYWALEPHEPARLALDAAA